MTEQEGPMRIRVVGGQTAHDTFVYDQDTGKQITNVTNLWYRADGNTGETLLTITLLGDDFLYEGESITKLIHTSLFESEE